MAVIVTNHKNRQRTDAIVMWTMSLPSSTLLGFITLVLFYDNGLATSADTVDGSFRFTSPTYNVSIFENSFGRTYVAPTVSKMGIYRLRDLAAFDVAYTIVDGDASRLFKAESRRVGDFNFLRIRTRSGAHAVINREQQDLYRLVVRAMVKGRGAPARTARAEIIVHVIDVNDLSPLFDPVTYEVDVMETEPIHHTVVKVSASDADVGLNGEILYAFSTPAEMFAIHPTTGVVTLARQLSFNDAASYHFEVVARDRGPTQERGTAVRISRAMINVNVIEVNQHSPSIELQELPTVVEHGKVGTIYAILYVTDRDYGRNGQIANLEITDGDLERYFSLQKTSEGGEYRIYVAKTLDREKFVYGFNLTVTASDRGIPSRNGSKLIHVRLQDTNDNSPTFAQTFYNVSIMECLPILTPVVRVTATDHDEGRNAETVYKLIGGGAEELFSINPSNGLVSVAGVLDAELITTINLVISAHDRANNGSRKMSRADLRINVLDCNDNSPVFRTVPQVVHIDENQPEGTTVYRVEAQDLDSGDNGFISYSLANTEDIPFAIDHFTGVIHIKTLIDFETMKRSYSLVVRASDWGSPFRRETDLFLKVNIRDINDNRPQFEKVDCVGYLSRIVSLGTDLLGVSAIDFDMDDVITYRIVSGNDDTCFEINPSNGRIITKCLFTDNHGDVQRTLVITASDGIHSAQPMTVQISLIQNGRGKATSGIAGFTCRDTAVAAQLDTSLKLSAERNSADNDNSSTPALSSIFSTNHNAPIFDASIPRLVIVREDAMIGSEVLIIRATDTDHGYNSRLAYVISSGNVGDVFTIGSYTGALSLAARLDRESRDRYWLNITVGDMGTPSYSASTMIEVVVEDVNDNRPLFLKTPYVVSVTENVPVNSTVYEVQAIDLDIGANGRVMYQIAAGEADTFSVDRFTGMIRVRTSLDRERRDRYDVPVIATDRSTDSPLATTATVVVLVTDVNDNAPSFVSAETGYYIQTPEDMPAGTVITTLYARDMDSGVNGQVRYRLGNGTDDNKFTIDHITGAVQIAHGAMILDPRQRFYNVTVLARDRGDPYLSCTTQLIIELLDVGGRNLYAPSFQDIVFTSRVRENQPALTRVLQVIATDRDQYRTDTASPADYDIIYSIRDGTGLGRFSIDSNGVIYTKESLDRETRTHYWLTVFAQDSGAMPRSSMTEIYIEVDDINDNIPQTVEPVYFPAVQEGSSDGVSVIKLEAYDLDETANNMLMYDITGGNPQGFFAIDRMTGLITTTHRTLDREKQDQHILEVTVTDNGIPSLSSTTRVVVSVTDVNDEEPIFLDYQYRVRIPRLPSHLLSMGVFRVVAYDRDADLNAELEYSIIGSASGKDSRSSANEAAVETGTATFGISPTSGMIFAIREFESHETQFDLQVKATDRGRPRLSSTTRVIMTVIDIPQANESVNSAPQFYADNSQQVHLMESDEIGHMVSLLTCTDPDGDMIWFFITDGNVNDTFSIETQNGNIILARHLNWEQLTSYNLTVMATDGIHQAYTWMSVQVLDINDNSPQFDRSTYSVDVNENIAIGTEIFVVKANDLDEDRRLFYTLQSATGGPTSLAKFKINSETGVLTTLDVLNHEAVSRHELTVMVRDQGTPSKRSLARIVINVLDQNDHAPEFLASKLEGRIYSTAPIGTSVLPVVAIDRDKGSNAEIQYSILSGNLDGSFSIDRVLGIIMVSRPLDAYVRGEYTLIVRATDAGSPSLSSTVTVHIVLTMSNDAPPKFDQVEYTAEVAENQPVGTYVTLLRSRSGSSVVYRIVSGNGDGLFAIDPSSGVVFTEGMLDFEQRSFYNLTARATNIAGAFVDVSLAIHVTDQNDNRPTFLQLRYYGNVSESATAGSYILYNGAPLVVHAADNDSNENAQLLYHIVDSRAAELFEMDINTAALRTRVVLDRELVSMYEFDVQVVDLGYPASLSAEVAAHVTIYVDNVNDSPPVFSKSIVTVTLLLPTQADVVLAQFNASDADEGDSFHLQYYISDDEIAQTFRLDRHKGILTVSNVTNILDRYEFAVTATDGKYESRCIVQIVVEFIKSTGLRFTTDTSQASISENVTVIREMTVVQPVGHLPNEHLTFTLLNHRDLFAVRATSGSVYNLGVPFDRESINHYVLVIEVRDQRSPQRVAHTLLNVTVTDINDNAPVFVNQPYFAVFSVDTPIGENIKTLKAIDRDIGVNGIVDYYLLGGDNSSFGIIRETGEIVIMSDLSHVEKNKQLSLIVEARDRGENSLSSRVEVLVTVMDKATPKFDEPFYQVNIAENLSIYGTVAVVRATSPTSGKLVYSIHDGDIGGLFAVDFSLGAVIVLEQLDYELTRDYMLTIRAIDIHSTLYADTILKIIVEDVNDHAPVFDAPVYTIFVSEAIPIGTTLLTLNATDQDSGLNARLHYHIELTPGGPVNDASFFHVDSTRRVLVTKQKLDHEQTKSLNFVIVVSDSGVPMSRSSSATITVEVTDVNDNAPKFDQLLYESSISDQSQRGQFVTVVRAADEDSLNRGGLRYAIVGGNDRQTFVIDPATGVITLSSIRRPSLLSSGYTLNVSVTDGVFTVFTRVAVAIVVANRHEPVFTKTVYEVSVRENQPAGTTVIVVTAVDKDDAADGIRYKIVRGLDSTDELFHINVETGLITTATVLDRENSAIMELIVAAQDSGGRVGFTLLRVTVTDESDQTPSFLMKNYKANVYSNVSIGSPVLKVMAIDHDIGTNAEIKYSIVKDATSSNSSKFFDIDSLTGLISTKLSLANLDNELLQFFVRAQSPPGANSRFSAYGDVSVEIYVMSGADRAPIFPRENYIFFVPENLPAGSVVATVSVVEINDSIVVYSIIPGHQPYTNHPTRFIVDKDNGTIRIALVNGVIDGKKEVASLHGVAAQPLGLDREMTETFELTLRAETRASPPLVAHAHVTIKVTDVNDNQPLFERNEFRGSVAENTAAGFSVLHVIAHDPDANGNGDVSYRLSSKDEHLSNVFIVDSRSGWITTAAMLDREVSAQYKFDVLAADSGSPSLSSLAAVTINIIDENDEAPTFVSDHFYGAVNEDALPGTIMLHLSASDRDEAPNNIVAYYITGGDALGQFSIRKNGELYVNRELDRETNDSYDLTVIATDSAFATSVRVSIAILDANDNAPICDQISYESEVAENVAIGHSLPWIRVMATDADEHGTRNSRVEYQLGREDAEVFSVHRRTGVISTKVALDRETTASYHLKVIATDGGGLSCICDVFVTVTDVNDNPPHFLLPQYFVTVSENLEKTTLVARVTAVDSDIGVNRRVTYMLEQGSSWNGTFAVDAMSGVVSLLHELDREEQETYKLLVYAADQGTPRLSSSVVMTVVLLDVNDNAPEFERNLYPFSVKENMPIGYNIGRVYATSRDTGVNAEMTYSFISAGLGSETKADFAIDPKTGLISIAVDLDYEMIREYVFTVQATDSGVPPLSSTTVVVVTVTDANDNSPVFTETYYHATVLEDVVVNTILLQVEATDADSGLAGELYYVLIGGDVLGHFSVNRSNGVISVASPLDREQIATYILTIGAIDNGESSLTSTVNVTVELIDVNDCQPRIVNSNLTATIKESIATEAVILSLEVSDNDLEPNGEPFTYDIIDGNVNNTFGIDLSGNIRLIKKLDRSLTAEHRLRVRISDSGSPSLHSEVIITVAIVEESRSPPEVLPLAIVVMAADDSFPGGIIGRIKATDRDESDELKFSIVNVAGSVNAGDSGLFAVDADDGTVRAVQSLDSGAYILNVSVTDGHHIRYTDVNLVVEGLDAEAADSAVIVRFENLVPEEFVSLHRRRFMLSVKTSLGIARDTDIKILSIQAGMNITGNSVPRKRRSDPLDPREEMQEETVHLSNSPNLDVLMAVRKTANKYIPSKVLKRRLDAANMHIQQLSGLRIQRVIHSICTKDSCSTDGDCVTVYQFRSDESYAIMADGVSYVTVPYDVSVKCVCKPGSSGVRCADKGSAVCSPGLCKEPKVCHSNGQSYTCSCPEGRSGEDCRETIEQPCTDHTCRKDKPLTFSGFSYVKWRLTVSMERRLSLSLDLKTIQRKARLMHAVGRVDYSILEIEDGMIQYRFDCGSGPGQARVDKVLVSDGYWHTVVVERIRQSVKIIIDGKYLAEGSAPGVNDVLNLDSNDVYFGAEVETLAHGFDDIKQAFIGCMQKIKIDTVELPLVGSSQVAILQHLQDIEFHCQGSYIPGVCSSSPCRNGGTCLPLSADTFLCKCRSRFTGLVCDVDTDPCASQPCLNNGICEKVPNDEYRCTCQGRARGRRCELTQFCDLNNPLNGQCRNGGRCIQGPGFPICECIRGYKSDWCERDIDECLMNPCSNGATCFNLQGSFLCNCTTRMHNGMCADTKGIFVPEISSTPWSSRPEEIIGIIVAVFALLFLVIVFVFALRWCRRLRRRQHQRRLNKLAEDEVYGGECLKPMTSGVVDHNGAVERSRPTRVSDAHRRCHDDEIVFVCNAFQGSSLPRHSPSPPRRPSPRPPQIPKRPASYTPSGADSSRANTLNNIHCDVARDYGSAADELEEAGTHEPIVIPAFLLQQHNTDNDLCGERGAVKQKTPLLPPKRLLPSPPSSSGRYYSPLDQQAAVQEEEIMLLHELNNLNKPENHYSKSSKQMNKIIPATNFSSRSLEELQTSAITDGSVPSLSLSGSDDETQVYHWNTSDWDPALCAPMVTGPSNRLSSESNNLFVDGAMATVIDGGEGYESEYVGDSEYTENELGDDDDDEDIAADYPSSIDFQTILAMRDELNYGTDDFKNRSTELQLNLADLAVSRSNDCVHDAEGSSAGLVNSEDDQNLEEHDESGEGRGSSGMNGNYSSADFISRDNDDDVIFYGYPPRSTRAGTEPASYRPNFTNSDPTDGGINLLDDMSLSAISVGGFESTYTDNDSVASDIAGLCEIEDSEANESGDEVDEEDSAQSKLLPKKLQTDSTSV